MTNADKSQEGSRDVALAFAWETLPELAKSRWEEAVAFDVTIENQLAKAKEDRTRAEIERQRIAREVLEATKEVCEEIVTEGNRGLDSARRMEAEAVQKLEECRGQLEEAQALKAEAQDYRERVMAEVEQQAQELLSRTRANVEQECMELKEQASLEAKRILGQAEKVRAAIQTELETQRIYTETARLKAESHEVLARIKGKRGELMVSYQKDTKEHQASLELTGVLVAEVPGEPTPVVEELPSWQPEQGRGEPALAEELPKEEPQQSMDSEDAANGKKSTRRSIATK